MYPYFGDKIVNSNDSLKHANVISEQGKKHNKSYGKYFDFGIVNKYRIQDGLSFGKFQGKKINNQFLEEDIYVAYYVLWHVHSDAEKSNFSEVSNSVLFQDV